MHLSETELNTIAVLRFALNPKETAQEIAAGWDGIEKELNVQTVAGLLTERINGLGMPEETRRRFTSVYGKNLREFYQILQEQAELEKALEGIEYVVLKGTAAAMYYPHPELRQMGDIDILVKPENYEKAASLLENAGYEKGVVYYRHTGLESGSGIHIELHQRFSSSENVAQNAVLDETLYKALPDREMKELCGYQAPVLPKLENGLVLLGHINQHLSSGLGLRQIVDWMMYVRNNLDDAFWNESFKDAAESIGMRQLAEVTTLLCKKHLGLEEITWCDGADEALADELLEYIMSKGNFGRKKEKQSRNTVTVMHKFTNPVRAFKYLTAGGMIHWKAAQKHKILKPFAWIYQIGHLIRMGLKRKTGLSTFIRELKQSKSETDLLDRINVTRK